ncbi:MAG: extracellular solute-binding protein [Hyphomicrobiaceae bacterium]|nr:extracellular solute-binding protein [Hyphomicrobiaceae bacterium]
MHGEPKHPAQFAHFDAVVPGAPKGGRMAQGVLGTFDSLNPYIIKGLPAAGVRDLVTESLLARGLDEPFTLYGLLAQSLEVPDDRSEVIFNLNPAARFSDGTPVTPADVLFSFEVLKERGRPNHRSYFQKVERAHEVGERRVRFKFASGADRELPLILGLMPILSSKALTAETFEQTRLDTFLGSGPYRIARVDPGRLIVFERDPNWWGRDLSINRGRYNFDEVRFEYFRDGTTMFEAFRSGALDVRFEDDPGQWSQGYDFPAIKDGSIVKAELPTQQPAGMTGLVFNTRRPVLADREVRRALIQLFDFEFVNRSLYNGLYRRTQSYFERSVLSSAGRSADAEERRLLAAFPAAVEPAVMEGTAALPVTDGSGRNRASQQKALEMLRAAGWVADGGRIVNAKTKQPLAFEVMVNSVAVQRLLSSFRADLERVGIAMSIRQVEGTQYQARLRTYDYDMIVSTWPSSLSPGNEQTFRWSGKVGREEGSFNFAGVDNPAADAMIDAMLSARSSDTFLSAVRALDRVLRSGDYVIPLYHAQKLWIAHKRTIRMPASVPVAGLSSDTWWME